MSVTTIRYLYCDYHEGEPSTVAPTPESTAKELRVDAKMQGWQLVRYKGLMYDRCPDCKAIKGPEEWR